MRRISYISLMISALLAVGCHSHPEHGDEHDHDQEHGREAVAPGESGHGHDEIVFPAEKAAAAGVVCDTVRLTRFSGVLPVSGQVLPASGSESTVAATVSGIVSLDRRLTPGGAVTKGAPLLSINTSALADGDVSRRARVNYEAALAEYERAKSLHADRLITEKEFNSAKSEYDRALIAYEAIGQGSKRGVSVSAPISGYITDLLVREGDYVDEGAPLAVISQDRRLFLRADVAEKDYPLLSSVRSASFRPASSSEFYDISELEGRLVSYGKSTNPNSAFIPVIFEFNNSGSILPGSYAEIYLITQERSDVIAVPESALTEEQGVYYVYIREDDDCYRKQAVTLGRTDGSVTEIVAGLAEGDVVVTSGAIHVKLAAAGKSIPGHTHNH